MLIIEKPDLTNALGFCEKAIERKNTIPILQNVMISGDRADSCVVLTATNLDLEVSVRASASLSVDKIAFTCPFVTLKDIAAKAASSEIRFDVDERNVVVRTGRSRFQLPVLPVSDFPALNATMGLPRIKVSAEALAAALDAVRFAISTEEARFYLNGIFLHRREDETLVLVATDGHRLARRALEVEENAAIPSVIIPRLTVPAILKLLDKLKEPVTIDVDDSMMRLVAGNATLVSKLVDGTFPDYERVIPTPSASAASIEVKPLSDAIDRVNLVAGDRDSRVRFGFAPDALSLSAKSADLGEAEDQIPCEGAQTIETAFNGRYALEALTNLGADRVEILQADAGAPAILRAPGAATNLIVLMPMRL